MKRIILDVSVHQTRIALIEDGELVELIQESKQKESILGNIYMGRVCNVLPGMQAAFVDIGENKNAYLYYGEAGIEANSKEEKEIRPKTGQEFLVQVEKSASGSKGAVVTRKLSFPGKFLVLMPGESEIGISKKITEQKERSRIRKILEPILPEKYGVIVRTEGAGKSQEDYEKEIKRLIQISGSILKASFCKAPSLIYQELSPVMKAARELFSDDIAELIVNDQEIFELLQDDLKQYNEKNIEKIKLYEEAIPIFVAFGIESQAEKALHKKVWLKSGGFLVIEQTEACVVIDVNTGKYTGKKDFQTTILKTNLEAADEIAKQLRLRNLSGMIIVDFIDLKKEEDKWELRREMERAVKKDRIKTNVVGMTELGLMQITRKKTGPSLWMQMTNPCQCCSGSGRVPVLDHLVGEIRRKVISIFCQTIYDQVTIQADSRLLNAFAGNDGEFQSILEQTYKKKLILIPSDKMLYGQYEIKGLKKADEKPL